LGNRLIIQTTSWMSEGVVCSRRATIDRNLSRLALPS
jgi:hypothetical protein